MSDPCHVLLVPNISVDIKVDNRNYVSESSRKALDKFKFRPQVTSSVNESDNLKVESKLHNPNFVSDLLLKAEPKAELKGVYTDNQNYTKEDDKLPLFLGGLDSEVSSDYGSDSGLFELCRPMLDIHQGSHTCPNNDARIMNNRVKTVWDEEFRDIDEDEMLEVITYLEKHTTSELAKNRWDSDSDMDGASVFDDYPTTENQADNENETIRNASREEFLQLHLLPITTHNPATREKKPSTNDIFQGQNQPLSAANKNFHVSHICPPEELPRSPEPGIVIENSSTPSDVKSTLNDYSQDQGVSDLDLLRSTPPENFVEVSKYFQDTTSDACASKTEMRESCENLDILGDISDIDELLSGANTISCEDNEEVPGGAVGAVGPENERRTEGKGDENTDVDVVEIEKEIERKRI
ncbi:hypothetical protein DFP73DRAFT_628206 [Morchella snyderi]|nr:hypothetical protein DFP73DRAFT_628206 [Morchella snyderi]